MEFNNLITSTSNPLVKRIKRLQDKARYRRKEESFWVEGVPVLKMALGDRSRIEKVVFCGGLLVSDEGREMLSSCIAADVECVAVSEAVFRHLSQRNNPDGMGATCKADWKGLRALDVGTADVIVAVQEISEPGNLGTILRTMDAVLASALILIEKSTQPYHPRAVRASRGAIFTIPQYHCPDVNALFEWAETQGIQTVATSSGANLSFWEAPYRFPILVLLGNEHRGLDATTIRNADLAVTIPIAGTLSSLNISVTASLVLYELQRLRTR